MTIFVSFIMENNTNTNSNNKQQIECIICLQFPVEPIVTQCGHIYCWKCIQQWLSDKKEMTCAICKNGVDLDNVIPLFGGQTGASTDKSRPKIKKIEPVINENRPGYVIINLIPYLN